MKTYMKSIKTYSEFTNESMNRDLCDRCNKPTGGITTRGIFNRDVICFKCKEDDKNDPDYKQYMLLKKSRIDAEIEEVRKGGYNYKGHTIPILP